MALFTPVELTLAMRDEWVSCRSPNAVLWVIWAVDGADTDDIWPAWATGIWGVFVVSQAWRVYRAPDGRPSEQQIQQEMHRLRNR